MRPDHRALDPRAKLAFAAVVVVLAVVIPRLDALAALGLLLAVVVAAGRGLTLRDWLATLAPFKLLVPVILVLNVFFYGGGTVLWAAAPAGLPLRVTEGGLVTSGVIAGRLLVIAAAASWFASTTEAETFEAGLDRLGVPWSLAFVVSLTLRLVPELRDRYREIEVAQRSRGLSFEGGPLRRARARIPMFIPFFAAVVQYGYDLGEALEVRGYGRSADRTSLVSVEHRPVDYGLYAASVAVLVAFLAVFVA